jgi:hypothetical protein
MGAKEHALHVCDRTHVPCTQRLVEDNGAIEHVRHVRNGQIVRLIGLRGSLGDDDMTLFDFLVHDVVDWSFGILLMK